ncbi:MAG: xanthine dehydrogenase family protein [Actinobacteria bacterium]|nr:xanthine dehydrogenase family protein [Actinomycetota bacterium]
MTDRPHTVVPPVRARHIGASVPRREDPKLLTGRGRYLADTTLPGELQMVVVRSQEGHARIGSIDVEAARASAGVHAVLTAAEVTPICAGMEGALAVEGCETTVMPLLADGVTRYAGEPVAVVVAESRAAAEDAADRVLVDYESLPAVTDPDAALAGGPLANDTLESNLALSGAASYGDVEAAFASAARVVRARYHTGRVSPLPVEARGCLAEFTWGTEELRLWTSTQAPHLVGYFVSLHLGIPEHLIEVLTPDTGGGFGLKAHVYPEELLVCIASRELDRPVKWVEDRREHLLASIHAHEQLIDIAYAIDAEGRITGQRLDALGDGGAYHSIPWSMAVEPWCGAVMNAHGVYDIPNFEYTYKAVATNKSPVGAYRGVGYMSGNLVHEALADEAARELGISPFEFRRRNVVRSLPFTNPQGITYEEGSWAESIDALERLVDYDAFLERQRRGREEGRYLGLGISVFVESCGESTATSQAFGLGDTYFDSATVKMEPQGKVTVTTGLTTQGQGNRITMAQIAADVLGVEIDDVVVRCGESSKYAYGTGTIGSRAAVVAGGAVMRAGDAIRRRLVQVAAGMLEVAPFDIVLEDGKAFVNGAPERSVTIADVATAIYYDDAVRTDGFETELEVTTNYDPARPIFSNGAHAFIVEVDVETGLVRVERAFAVEDCGTMINPAVVEGQIRGGMTQGLGAALFEELVYDESGQLLTTNLADYLVPTMDVAPPFSFHHIETPSSHTPGGIKGMGESGLIASPGAMLNAVNDALSPFGVTLRRTPMTPERILDALALARA